MSAPGRLPAWLRRRLEHIAYWPRAFRLIWAAAPGWSVAWGLLLIAQGLLPLAFITLSSRLLAGLVEATRAGGWEAARPLLTTAGLLALVVLLTEALQTAAEWVRTTQAEYVQDHIIAQIHRQSIAVDLSFYESSDYFDRLDRARGEARQRPLALLESAGALVQNGITLLTMSVVLLPYGLWMPLALLASTLPALLVVVRTNRQYHRWWKGATAERRWTQYYDTLLTYPTFAAELRLFGIGPGFQEAYRATRRRLRGQRLRLARRQSIARLGASLLALIGGGAAIGWMAWRALNGLASLGDLALFYQAFERGQSLLRSLLGNLGQIYGNSLFLKDLFAFLDMRPQVASPAAPAAAPPALRQGLRLSNITFRYPGSERIALEDFSLEIPAGKLVAIVGPNGAGKSTLLKLLCRFYDPEAGAISVDGTDLRALDVAELRRMITVLFQQPVPYQASARDNILLGNPGGRPADAEVVAAAQAAGAHELIARLPQGYDTMLGKLFSGGTDLSGGEWQRVALARAFLRPSPIVILDEPTSAMDSWAEARWLDRFRELVRGRTALIITHRFTTAMRADVIHVMDGGRIVESGSHAELLARGGLYARSWEAQTRDHSLGAPLSDSLAL